MDFELILVIATAVSGALWLLDKLVLAPARQRAKKSKEPLAVEYARAFFPVLLVVLLLRSFVAEPFRIPSGSMMPTLLVGDFILVNKFSYGLRLPVSNTKIIGLGEPERGDVVVFRYPRQPQVDYIKRVIGLPGDRIVYKDKMLYINGEPIAQEPVGIYKGDASNRNIGSSLRKENLMGTEHEILVRAVPGIEGEYRVPEGHYFVMGDNRDNSNDSRYWGYVPEQNLVGKAFLVWMHLDFDSWGLEPGRIGLRIE